MNKLEFCQNFVYLDRQPISFAERPYLPAIYDVGRGNLLIRASRQVEKSTFLANTIIYEACTNPDAQILFVSPRVEQASAFSSKRLLPVLKQSPVIRRVLMGPGCRTQVTNYQFSNGATLAIRAAFHSADACRGLSANLLLVDEFQDTAVGNLPVLQETLSHAKHGRTILTGTPKMIDNHFEAIYAHSTANEWTLTCPQCQKNTTLDERCLGSAGVVCPTCQAPLDSSQGRWVARNPTATWGQGFGISHLMVPWINYDDILERQRSYDPVRFRNEVLGLPTSLGDHVVTRQELEECCANRPMARSLNMIPNLNSAPLFAGVDWGGGVSSRTVLIIGRMRSDFVFEVLYFEAFQAREDPNRIVSEVARLCNAYRVAGIAADGAGNGHVYNRLLWKHVQPPLGLYAIHYSTVDHTPCNEGVLTRWTVNRSASIGVLFVRVKQRTISFPCKEEVGNFLDEFACEIAKYDDEQRAIKYTHPETQQDDALHAVNYGLSLATRSFHGAHRYEQSDEEGID